MDAFEGELILDPDPVSPRMVLLFLDPFPPSFEEVRDRGGGVNVDSIDRGEGLRAARDDDFDDLDSDRFSDEVQGLLFGEAIADVVMVEADECLDPGGGVGWYVEEVADDGLSDGGDRLFLQLAGFRPHIVVREGHYVVVGDRDTSLDEEYGEVAVHEPYSLLDQLVAEVFREARYEEDEGWRVAVAEVWYRRRRVCDGRADLPRSGVSLLVEVCTRL
jgi:hypothetical protein